MIFTSKTYDGAQKRMRKKRRMALRMAMVSPRGIALAYKFAIQHGLILKRLEREMHDWEWHEFKA